MYMRVYFILYLFLFFLNIINGYTLRSEELDRECKIDFKKKELFIEIDKNTYESLEGKKKKYDPNLYRVGTLTWSLKENPIQTNNLQIQKLERSFPLISTFFTNLSEYKRNNPQNTEISENLIANQGELFYLDGRPYPEGALYHMHPTKGPMVGATHIPEFHASLSYSSVPSFPQTPEETPPPQPSSPPLTTPPTPQSQPSSPSRGGGY